MDILDRKNLSDQPSDLFRATAEDHHRAFLETDGLDPDWPLWYADACSSPPAPFKGRYNQDRHRRPARPGRAEAAIEGPGWRLAGFYASFFIDRYSGRNEMVIFDEQVTQQIIEAFNQRNLEPVLKFFAEDTVLHCPGKHQVAGDYHGAAGC
jgi:hypothetical protein